MPIYEYACEKCQAQEEVLQKHDEAAPEKCPSCGAKGSLKKIVSNSAFHLKGGGWYKDLYSSTKKDDKGSKKTASPKTDKPAGDKPEKKSEK